MVTCKMFPEVMGLDTVSHWGGLKTLRSSGDTKDGILSWKMYKARRVWLVLGRDMKGERQLSESSHFLIGRKFHLYMFVSQVQ